MKAQRMPKVPALVDAIENTSRLSYDNDSAMVIIFAQLKPKKKP
jgi:hypothetical protein